jgi:Fe-S cluster biogenesis protein NfuA
MRGKIFYICLSRKERKKFMEEDVKKVLEKVRPALQADGGDVEFVAMEGDVVKVRLRGACGSCPMSTMTLKQGIEVAIKREVPGISRVEAVR